MADFDFAYQKFCPVEVNECPMVRNLALPPIIKTDKLSNCTTVKLINSPSQIKFASGISLTVCEFYSF
jgi:hypothetical protein